MLYSKKYKCFLFLFTFLCSIHFVGQENNFELVTKKINVNVDTLVLDSASVNPRTFKVYNQNNVKLDNKSYSLLATSAKVVFHQKINDTLIFKYHRFTINLNKDYYIHNENLNRKKESSFNICNSELLFVNRTLKRFSLFSENTARIAEILFLKT